jgi:ligand-binding sensor domain-containing protein/two-component sensor histidine kinase
VKEDHLRVDELNGIGSYQVWLRTCLLSFLLLAPGLARAEQLPIKTYTTADGLANDSINQIVRDSRGFLWFCTADGLSRFDGYEFTNYTTDQGLPHRWVSDLLETRDGSYWIATGGGVSRFNQKGAPLFTTFHPSEDEASWHVEVLVEDRDGVIWCGTHRGLYRLADATGRPQFQFVEMGMPTTPESDFVQAILADSHGALWVGTRASGLYRRSPGGRVEHYTTQQGLPGNRVEALLEDREGRLWVGTADGLGELVATRDPDRPVIARRYTTNDGLPTNWIASLFQSADGKLWMGTEPGLVEFLPSSGMNGPQFRVYTTANVLRIHLVGGLSEDRDGDLWIATDSGGAMKLARSRFTTYTEADGLAAAGVDAVFENKAGALVVISSGTRHFINRLDGQRFAAVWPDFPKQVTNFGWGYNQVTLQDRAGEWWVPTGQGLLRFPAVTRVEQLAHTPPKAIYTTRDGLPFDDVFRLYEDSHGDIWISTISGLAKTLSRWERATQRLQIFSETDGFVSLKMGPPDAFGEDGTGNLWIGHWGGGLTRYAAGHFVSFTEADGLPAGAIRALYLDHAHRLWIASSLGGLARVDDPAAVHPRFNIYTTREGLSSNDVWCITEDLSGHIYVGTGRGLDRFDPETGHNKHYTAADGLLVGKVTSAYRDSHGVLWFASNVHGLSRLLPQLDPAVTAPPILISGLRIAGEAYPLSRLGETELQGLDLGPNQNQLNVDFVGLDFASGEVLRYQYKLEGADRDWSVMSDHRSVNYANLAPGRYRFLVRAVNAEGITSTTPATLAFTILPPVWRRWWFLALFVLAIGVMVYTLYRSRVTRILEVANIRTRIATDLHDDIGASLSLIAMLSEVAQRQWQQRSNKIGESLSSIAEASRESVGAMSDIVWAVNPSKDRLGELIKRMRRFASDVLSARNILLQFEADFGSDVELAADARREILSIFKEGVNNIARHSGSRAVTVNVLFAKQWLTLTLSDDGQGFDVANPTEGNGLDNMRQRARKLGGELKIASRTGQGVRLTLRVPLTRARRPVAKESSD